MHMHSIMALDQGYFSGGKTVRKKYVKPDNTWSACRIFNRERMHYMKNSNGQVNNISDGEICGYTPGVPVGSIS